MGKINIDIKSGSLSNQGLAVGIDLGTTNSLVALVEPTNQQVEVLPINGDKALYPSLVRFSTTGGERLTGSEALSVSHDQPDQLIYSIKRLIGMSQADYLQAKKHYGYLTHSRYGTTGVELSDPAGNWHSAIDLSSYILSAIAKNAASLKQQKVTKAVVTVPAYFDESQRAATKLAGEKAGLEVLRIINEPTAACLAFGYGDRSENARHLVVYDLGGGTFDVSVVRAELGVFEVLSTHGDTQLGGDDIDRSIVQYWQQQNPVSAQAPYSSSLRLLAKKAKEELGSNDPFLQQVEGVDFALSRVVLERLAAPWVDRTLASCQQALEDAGLNLSDIDDVLMVGGSTRMPYIKKRVSAFFKRPVNDQLNPDEVVAIGAALQAAQLNGTEMGHLLLDVTPLSLGIETSGGLMDILIPRNAKIPTRVSRQYTTQRDGQTSIRISVYQGERDLIQHNRELSRFNVSGIPAMPAGMPKLDVTFQIDANGLLRVEARELRSGIHQEVIVNPAENLTKDQIDQRLEEAFSHAEADKETRSRIQLVEEAEILVVNLRKLLSANRDWIEPSNYEAFMSDCLLLENTIQQEGALMIKDRMQALESRARPLAEEAMNRAVGNHLRNTSI